jgi:NAD(P)-dependent dehydrogenase (short-subunit alcohol dehydrogenase family)
VLIPSAYQAFLLMSPEQPAALRRKKAALNVGLFVLSSCLSKPFLKKWYVMKGRKMRQNSIDMKGRVAIVTGAASGIGRASARVFAAAGAQVLACDVNTDLGALAGAYGDKGGAIHTQVMDAGSETDVKAAVDRAVSEFGHLDAFFANAGITGGVRSLAESSPEIWAEVLRVNLIGPALAIRHAGPVLAKQGGGAIVATASVAGMRANGGPPAYSASKAGVINLVQTAAYELSGTNVRVNAICPGLIETEMTRPIYDYARGKGNEAILGLRNPTQRGGEPEEIANVALFLCSPLASYINAQAVPVCGGLSASHPFGERPDPVEAAEVIARYRASQAGG